MAGGGEGGIRTHGPLAGTPLFESGTLNHSDTSPYLNIERTANPAPLIALRLWA
jgi:hypothetical protein